MRNKLTALAVSGLLAFGAMACEGTGDAPVDPGAADPAAPADPGAAEPAPTE